MVVMFMAMNKMTIMAFVVIVVIIITVVMAVVAVMLMTFGLLRGSAVPRFCRVSPGRGSA